MKTALIEIGQLYRAKVSGKVVIIRITGTNPYKGWDAVNTVTGRAVRIKSPQRVRPYYAWDNTTTRNAF